MKKIFLGLLLLAIIAACTKKSGSAIKVVTETSQGIKAEYEMDTIRKVKHGFYRSFWPNGKLACEMTYQNDTLVGKEKNYHENGKLSGEFFLVAGKYQGDFKYYFENGVLMQEGRHENNAINGELKTYYENGKLKEMVIMSENKEKGPFTEYYDNGKLKTKGEYAGGTNTEYCLLETFKEDGSPEKKMICNGEGICCTIWTLEKGDAKPSSSVCEKVIDEMKEKCKLK
jgi:antitoxin component YwqK of YwqJK toxin-antitoxin module